MKHSRIFMVLIIFLLFLFACLLAYYMGLSTVKNGKLLQGCKPAYSGNGEELFLNGVSYKEALYNDLASLPIAEVVNELENAKVIQSKNIIESIQTNKAEGVVLKIDTNLTGKGVPFAFLVTLGTTNDTVSYMYKENELPFVSFYTMNKDNSKTKSTYMSIKKGDYLSVKEEIDLKNKKLIKAEITIVPN